MAYLEHNPDVVSANAFFVWEVVTGGFSHWTSWTGDSVFPRDKLVCGTCYFVRRYIVARVKGIYQAQHQSELPPVGPADPKNIVRFESMISKVCVSSRAETHRVLLLYPKKAELADTRRGVVPGASDFDALPASTACRS